MANPYKATIRSISTDGTNLFLEVEVFDGSRTLPYLYPTFPVGTAAATITSYVQTIANNQPALTADIEALVNSVVIGA